MAPTMPHPSEATLLLALDRELDAQELANVLEHVGTCDPCRANWQRLAVLSADVEQYCHAWPPLGVEAPARHGTRHAQPARLRMARLTESLLQARSNGARVARLRDVPSPAFAALAAAAALLLAGVSAAWLLVARGGADSSASPTPATMAAARKDAAADAHTDAVARGGADRSASPTPATMAAARRDVAADAHAHDIALAVPAAASVAAPAASAATPLAPSALRAERVPKAARVARAADAAVRRPTYYWSLPYSNRALPLDEGTVEMTVNLSREQLRLAGIPVSESRTDARVRAKVLLGADGLPRAISFDTQD